MNYFQSQGRMLLSNGYLIIPIRQGEKRPALDHWQSARLGAGDIPKYQHFGVGVLCGQGAHPISAIDIDTTNAELSERFKNWCLDNLGLTCERVGNAPKVLLAYRAEVDGLGKATGAWFSDKDGVKHRLEILGRGQQFVAYHIHPDTNKPYEWVDLFGGLESLRASELPVITISQIEEALQIFEQMALDTGLEKVTRTVKSIGVTSATDEDDPFSGYEPPLGIELPEAKKLLSYVDNEDYDTWLKVGMSLHHEFEGSDHALQLWNEWSSTASNYKSFDDLQYRWSTFGQSGRSPTTAKWLLKVGRENKREAEREEQRSALEEVRAQISECTDSIDLVNDVARKAGEIAGTDLAARAELAGLIRARFKDLTSTMLPVADVRAAMDAGGKKVISFNKQKRQMTEFGNAERMLDHYGEGLMYVPEIEAWFAWTGTYWRRSSIVELEHLAKETIRALPDESKLIESDEERAAFFKFCAISQKAVMVRNMVSLAQSDPRVVLSFNDLDKHSFLFGCANGVVDLRNGKLLQPDPHYNITTISPVEYDLDAEAPVFEKTLSDVFYDNADMIGFFQRFVGYSLLGQPNEDIIAIPYGSGSNGKSTIIGAIREVLGEHARMAKSDTFLSNGSNSGNAGGAREDILRLRGARLVYVSEPDEGSELREGLIKSMTGGEPLPARGLYSTSTVEVTPTWVAVMPTNHRPIVKGDDHAIWRRLLPIPFTRNFDKDPNVTKDPNRSEKLKKETKGILAWCIRGALDYQKQGLNPPDAVRKAREDYKSDMDLLSEWLDECCEVDASYADTSAMIWASWEAFAKMRGELRYIASSKALIRRLNSKGFRSVKDTAGIRGRGLEGIRVKSVGDFD